VLIPGSEGIRVALGLLVLLQLAVEYARLLKEDVKSLSMVASALVDCAGDELGTGLELS